MTATDVPLFRPDALAARANLKTEAIQLARPAGRFAALITALLSALLLLAAGAIVEVPDRVAVAGVLMPAERFIGIHSPRAGVVRNVAVSDGTAVKSGDDLLEIGGQIFSDAGNESLAERAASLHRELRLIDESLAHRESSVERDVEAASARLKLLDARIAAAASERTARTESLALQMKRADEIASLISGGALARREKDVQEIRVLAARSSLADVEQRWLALRHERLELQSRAARLRTDLTRIGIEAGMQRESLVRELERIEDLRNAPITAPGKGQVAGVLVRDGSHVTAGQRLMTVVPPDSVLLAWLYVPAADAGRVDVGQNIELELRAFPRQLFGTLSATVVEVASVPVDPRQLDMPLAVSGAVFEIRAQLSSQSLGDIELPAGAPFSADLIRQRRSLLEWLLRFAG